MSNIVIVAIPDDDDYVWKISSEKVPHLTLLFLGDALSNPDASKIIDFTQHAALTTLYPFGMEVSRRGVLGVDNADVLFMGGYGFNRISEFRSQLLKNDAIRKAYDSVEQFDGWTPHLTLGYPETPAHPDNRDYPGIKWVQFNKIAVWIGDYEGPTFELVDDRSFEEVSMHTDAEKGEEFIKHHGVLGMRWGHRKAQYAAARAKAKEPKPVEVTQKVGLTGKAKIKTKGGSHQSAHEDALRVAQANQKLKASGVHALSNKELQDVATRLDLEQRVSRLNSTRNKSVVAANKEELSARGKEHVKKEAGTFAAKKLAESMAKS